MSFDNGAFRISMKTNESLPDIAMTTFSLADISRKTLKVLQNYRVPVCFLALESVHGMYLKGRHGIDTRFVPFPSICHHEVLTDEPIVIPDITKDDPRLMNDPLVAGPPFARFYVGVPLIIPPQRCIGTLCLMDTEPLEYFSLNACHHMVAAARQIALFAHEEISCLICPTLDELGHLGNFGSLSEDSDSDDPDSDNQPSQGHRSLSLKGQDTSAQNDRDACRSSKVADARVLTLESLGDLGEEELREVESQPHFLKGYGKRTNGSSESGLLKIVMDSRWDQRDDFVYNEVDATTAEEATEADAEDWVDCYSA